MVIGAGAIEGVFAFLVDRLVASLFRSKNLLKPIPTQFCLIVLTLSSRHYELELGPITWFDYCLLGMGWSFVVVILTLKLKSFLGDAQYHFAGMLLFRVVQIYALDHQKVE